MTRHQCQHIQRGELPAVTSVVQTMVPGAPSIAMLETETLLCAICTGAVVYMLMRVERSGLLDVPP